MKILFISYDFPFPPSGGSISRDYNLIKQLSGKHELFWINRTTRGRVKDEYLNEMRKYFRAMKIVEWDYPQDYAGLVASIFTDTPYIIRRFRSEEMRHTVDEMLSSFDFDLIFCDHIYLAQYIPERVIGKIPAIPNNEDCGFSFYKRMSENSGPLRRAYAATQWRKILKYEIDMINKFGIYITTSETEKESLLRHCPGAQIKVAENGVDTTYFSCRNGQASSPVIIFSAWYGYYPNREAVRYFADEIFPLIRNRIPEAEFRIVGKEPPKSVMQLGNREGITVTGYVNDIRNELAKAAVSVAPLKTGGGTRLKILEAFASGVPVVSTSIGAEGLSAVNGTDIMIADEPAEFADKVLSILNDKALAQRLSENARLLAENRYDWNIIGSKLNNIIEEYVSGFRRATG